MIQPSTANTSWSPSPSTSKNPLDRIRPTGWPDRWNDALLDLLTLLTRSVDLHPRQDDLLERIVGGPLVAAADLPRPSKAARKPPG